MADCTPNPLTCYSSYDFIGEARPHRFPAFACFTDYSPIIPTFYWDVKSQEQRIKEICCTLQKAIKYTEALGEEYATVYNALIEFKEGILTAFEQYKTELNNKFENFKNDVNADQTAFENEIRQIQTNFEAQITERQNDFENLQTERQDIFENRITLRQTNFEEAQRTRQENFENDINAHITQFETEMGHRADAFEEAQRQHQNEFEQKINVEWSDYQNNLNAAWAAYQQAMNQAWDAWKTETGSNLDKYKNDLTAEWNKYQTDLTAEWGEFRESQITAYNQLRTEWENWRRDQESLITDWKDQTINELNEWKIATIAEFNKTFTDYQAEIKRLYGDRINTNSERIDILSEANRNRKAEIEALETSQAEQDMKLETMGADVNNLKETGIGHSQEIDALKTSVTNNSNNISFNTDRIEMLETSQAEQDTKITALETSQTAQDGKITALETSQTAQDGKITALETSDNAQDGKITALETSDNAQNTRLEGVETKAEMLMDDVQGTDTAPGLITRVTNVEKKATANADDISSLDSRVDALEAGAGGSGTPENYAKLTASVWGADEPAEAFDPDLHTLTQEAYDIADTARSEISGISNSIYGDTQPPVQIYPPLETQIKTVNNDVQGLDGRLETLESAINGNTTSEPPIVGLREEVGNLDGWVNGTTSEPDKSLISFNNRLARALTGNETILYPNAESVGASMNIVPRLGVLESTIGDNHSGLISKVNGYEYTINNLNTKVESAESKLNSAYYTNLIPPITVWGFPFTNETYKCVLTGNAGDTEALLGQLSYANKPETAGSRKIPKFFNGMFINVGSTTIEEYSNRNGDKAVRLQGFELKMNMYQSTFWPNSINNVFSASIDGQPAYAICSKNGFGDLFIVTQDFKPFSETGVSGYIQGKTINANPNNYINISIDFTKILFKSFTNIWGLF